MAELTYKRIMRMLEKERETHRKYRKQALEAADAARDDGKKKNSYNIQWSNNLIVRGAVFNSIPAPDVRRRFRPASSQDPQAMMEAREDKELARLIERAISYMADVNDYESPAKAVVKNLVEEGLGVPRVVYNVDRAPLPDPIDIDGLLDEETGEPVERTYEQGLEEIVSQDVGIEHIPAQYFHWEPGNTSWESVGWIAYESFRNAKEVSAEYGIEIKSGKGDDTEKRESEEYQDEIQLYEFLYKPTRTVYIVSPAHPEIIDQYEDKLNLKGFFPSPRPAFTNLKSNELIPKPDYQFIESQVVELNRITDRIKSISSQIKARGYYDASLTELGSLMTEADGVLKPVTNLVGKLDGTNFDKAISYLPLQELVVTLRELQAQRREVKEEIFEIIGIADIVRGVSRATETAEAQNLKGRWVGVRLQDKIDDIARLFRDVYRMVAEILCEHFDPMQLEMMTGIAVTPRMQQIMRSDMGRTFAVDIESESTVKADDMAERQDMMELVNILLEKMQMVIPAVQQGLLPVTFVQETLLLVISRYKNAKQLEDAVAELQPHLESMQQFQQQLQQMQQQLMQTQQQLQQTGQQAQGMQQALQKFNERKEAREDAKTQADIRKQDVETQAQQIENQIVAKEHKIDMAQGIADVDKTHAETDKIRMDTVRPMGVINA